LFARVSFRKPRPGLLATFGLAAIVPTAGLALVLGHLLRAQIRERAFDETKQSALVVAAALESQLSPHDLETALGGDRLLAVDGVIASLRSHGLEEAILWNGDGRAVYSTDRSMVGSIAPPSGGLRRALRGGAVSGMDRGRLDVLVPLSFAAPEAASGALELISPATSVQREITNETRVLYLLLLGGLAALYAVMLPIVWRISRRLRQHADENERLSLQDPLTGLPNRTLFLQRLRKAIAEREDGAAAVALIDLDRFKEINDILGHHSGDELLREFAARVAGLVRAGDCFARLGGDEFALLLTRLDDERPLLEIADRIAAALERPFQLNGLPIEIEASIGSALYPAHGDDVETLVRRADAAMYLAKRDRSGHEVWSPERDDSQPEQLALIGELRRALEQRELLLHYQPQARLDDGRIVAVEALLRWQHPTRGLLGPAEFIPLAQHTGLIRPLTLYVIEEALCQCERWRREGLDLGVAVNVAARNLLDPDFPEAVRRLVERSNLRPRALELELTETAVLTDPRRAAESLGKLEHIGVRLAIDDFGTGYSSLAYLHELPVHRIKIDRSFVRTMLESSDRAAIVTATIELARALGVEVTAEGVETPHLWARLRELGCDYAQGYFLSRPGPAREVGAWIARRQTAAARRLRLRPVARVSGL
jgi:diguanylate cyclase (GGDEF)-like protein